MSRVTEKDIERLQKAQQSMDLTQQALQDLSQANDPFLGDISLSLIKDVARMNERLKHLIEIADADVHQRKPRM